MRSFTIALSLLGLTACGQADIATPLVGEYLGSIAGDIIATDYSVTVSKVDASTVSIGGEGMTDVEFPLIEAASATTSAVGFADGVLSADVEAGTLDFTWTAGQNLTFSGGRDGADQPDDTSTPDDTDDTSEPDDTSTGGACDAIVPADAIVVTSVTNSVPGGANVLVCPGSTLNAYAGDLNVYVRGAATVNITGGNTSAWLDGASTLYVTGANTTVYATSAAGVTVVGSGTSQPSCASVTLDVSALASGC